MNLRRAIAEVNKCGALLVFPIKNRQEPQSLWSKFFPKSEMKWEWDDDGDHRVADLWHLRERLSSSGDVVYCKWYQNRATLISKDLLPKFVRLLNSTLSSEAQSVLDVLNDNSPLSTKQIKELTGLQGRFFESDYHKRMKELWQQLRIVAVGEIDDGAFPSLAISSAKLYFEEEWNAASKISPENALEAIQKKLGTTNPFFKYLKKVISV